MQIQKSFFNIGIYDPLKDEAWPWHCKYDGAYLSPKKRICSMTRAAEFDSAEKARHFYHEWKHRSKYKMKLIVYKKWVEITELISRSDMKNRIPFHGNKPTLKIVKND